MALPKLETPVYTLTVPSTDEEIKFRPFLVKEQKRMLMAQESDKDTEVLDAMKQLITHHPDYQLKPVISSEEDLFEVDYIQDRLDIPNDRMLLMPEGLTL